MRSIVGVGMTPPKVLGTPKPASSVMISSTFGAPFGGTTRGAHQGFDCSASSLITPPNFGSGGGSCLPLMVVVALGEPSVPVTCWAMAGSAANAMAVTMTVIAAIDTRLPRFMLPSCRYLSWSIQVGLPNHFSPSSFMYPAFSRPFSRFCSRLTRRGSPLGTPNPIGS